MERVIKILESYQKKYENRAMVLQLCGEDVSERQRGIIQGEINMLSKLMMDLAGSEDGKES